MEWKDLTPNTLLWMRVLGEFSPTTKPEEGMVKGSMYDHNEGTCDKTYFDSSQLRELSDACAEVAIWLEKRKAASLAMGE